MNMTSRATPSSHRTAKTSLTPPADRAWFLLDSDWDDPVWTFRPTNVLEETQLVRVRWSFTLPCGGCFTDELHASLLETSRQLVALIRARSLSTGLPQRASTVAGYFMYLRALLRWMHEASFSRFVDLDAQALLQFQRHLSDRPGIARAGLAPTTVQKYLYLFTYLYRFREQLGDGICFDPFPGRTHGQVAGVREASIRRWPYTPDAVAVALIQGSIDLLDRGTAPILQARTVYAQAMAAATQRGRGFDACTNAATRALHRASIVIPSTGKQIQSVEELAHFVDMLYAACFVVISYLVGPRVSEVLHLTAGCVQQRGNAEAPLTVIVGAIFKRQPEYHGRPHEWVAPPAAVQAITVLEALSQPHRQQAQRPNLWLRRHRVSGANEWHSPCPGTLDIPPASRIRLLLARLAIWLALPPHEGKAWVLTTHQGRKTFARFAALRDRSALFALAQHLGHRERAVTDQGYCGSDYRLNEEIDAEIMEQSAAAWEHMLAAPGLGGRAGAQIIAKRPRFRGARLKQDIKSYARTLVDAGLVLGVCDWGFCVYREDSSACLGNSAGPNPSRREPSTCARCANFVVSSEHRPYWASQVHQCEALLDEPSLPLQTLRIARERMQEAQTIIRSIDFPPKKGEHE
jgi:integrase